MADALAIAVGVWLGGTAVIATALLAVAIEHRVHSGRWKWPR